MVDDSGVNDPPVGAGKFRAKGALGGVPAEGDLGPNCTQVEAYQLNC